MAAADCEPRARGGVGAHAPPPHPRRLRGMEHVLAQGAVAVRLDSRQRCRRAVAQQTHDAVVVAVEQRDERVGALAPASPGVAVRLVDGQHLAEDDGPVGRDRSLQSGQHLELPALDVHFHDGDGAGLQRRHDLVAAERDRRLRPLVEGVRTEPIHDARRRVHRRRQVQPHASRVVGQRHRDHLRPVERVQPRQLLHVGDGGGVRVEAVVGPASAGGGVLEQRLADVHADVEEGAGTPVVHGDEGLQEPRLRLSDVVVPGRAADRDDERAVADRHPRAKVGVAEQVRPAERAHGEVTEWRHREAPRRSGDRRRRGRAGVECVGRRRDHASAGEWPARMTESRSTRASRWNCSAFTNSVASAAVPFTTASANGSGARYAS